jgi:hypothetical protein
MQKMMRFIKKKKMKFYQVHTSGHASRKIVQVSDGEVFEV